jgi:NAD(P)-dependent dehydrogenase (short-subunit alcohol dehydrogenase family)
VLLLTAQGASGIGEATVRLFVAEGAAAVAFADRDQERGDEIARELTAAGARVVFVAAETSSESDCQAFIQRTVSAFGRIDVLVNNAGVRSYLKVTEADEESWDHILGVNVKGYAFTSKYAIPEMIKAGSAGSIVNVASHRAVVAGPNTVQYDTSKAAVAGLTRSMARDHAADGVRVNSVAPGPTMTRFHELRNAEMGITEAEFTKTFAATTMLQRVARPVEVAHAILWLASEDASFATGSMVVVDGGASTNSHEGF